MQASVPPQMGKGKEERKKKGDREKGEGKEGGGEGCQTDFQGGCAIFGHLKMSRHHHSDKTNPHPLRTHGLGYFKSQPQPLSTTSDFSPCR